METSHSVGFFLGTISKLNSLDEIYVLLAKTPTYWKGIGTTADERYPFLYNNARFLKEIESMMKKNGYHYHLINRLIKKKQFRPRSIYERTLILAWLRKVGYFPSEFKEIHKGKKTNDTDIERRVYWVTAVVTPQGRTIRDINVLRRQRKFSSPDNKIEHLTTFPVKEALDRLYQSFDPSAPTYVGLIKGIQQLVGPHNTDILDDLCYYTSSLEKS